MDLELLTIGTEILLGFTVDTNSAEIARALASVGARLVRKTTVPDDESAIADGARGALARTGFVLTTGGLGPTRDDMTKRVVASLFGAPLEVDTAYLEELRARFFRLGRGPMPAINRTQAEIPRGAEVLPNRWGTAPGLWLEGAPGTVVMLPGVPREMRGLLEHEVLPRLGRTVDTERRRVIRSRVLRTTGIAESALAEAVGEIEDALLPATLAYLPSLEGVDLRLTVWRLAPDEADRELEKAVRKLRPALGRNVYGEGEADIAAVVLEHLEVRGLTLSVAESCTGGLVSQRLTAVPGASSVFVGGTVAYSNEAKQRLLEVNESTLAQHGAVSEAVVLAMVRGVGRQLGTEASIAVTGVAGPTGGGPDKPVGTVWVAAKAREKERAVHLALPGDRTDMRHRSAQAAFDLLRRLLD